MPAETRLLVSTPSVAQVLLNHWHSCGVTTLFAIPGAQVDGLLMEATSDDRFQIILAAHEQGAGYMADGFARLSGAPGVVIAINGPGATNLTTAAITAQADHSPVLFLTGDAPAVLAGYGGFQGSDSYGSNPNPVLKTALTNSISITAPDILPTALRLFERLMTGPAPAPLHINLPSDVAIQPAADQTQVPVSHEESETEPAWPASIPSTPGNRAAMLVGEEVRDAAAMAAIAQFSSRFAIPVATTLAARNVQAVLPPELSLGVFGYAGGPRAYEALLDPKLETLIVLGAVLDERNTAAWHPQFFQPPRTILRFSAYPETVRRSPVPILDVWEHPTSALKHLLRSWDRSVDTHPTEYEHRKLWSARLQDTARVPGVDTALRGTGESGIAMTAVLSVMNETLPAGTTLFLDSGDHRVYGGTFWEVTAPDSLFTAALTAPMGWAVGAAIGASFARPDKQIWVLTGDGCMLMHGMELAVAARHQCRVVFLVSNNGTYGRIAARLAHQPAAMRETIAALPAVSWVDFARSLGVPGQRAGTIAQLTAAIAQARASTGPFLIEVMTTLDATCPYPPAIFSSSAPGFAESWSLRQPKP